MSPFNEDFARKKEFFFLYQFIQGRLDYSKKFLFESPLEVNTTRKKLRNDSRALTGPFYVMFKDFME
jgi:hypothetical protein